ncbi:hypothetical protein ACFVGN_41175 [Streptomyces sp. NPDC057757]|uniref:hypothetical protein n=1 Tax=Streptomyces sp. NPDC057757 TaxID=3346241 RepID=UPI0036BDDF29
MTTYAYGTAVVHEVTVPDHEREAAPSPYTAEKPLAALRVNRRRVRAAGPMGGEFMT